MNSVLLPTSYLPPIQYFSKLISYSEISIELYEYFPKQTWRNRCNICGANGELSLIIPLQKGNEKILTKDIKISYDQQWQKLHWRSFEAAYRSSPFFEFYEDHFAPYYHDKKFEFLIDLNNELLTLILKLLKIKPTITYTKEYFKTPVDTDDLRTLISPKKELTEDKNFEVLPYSQVFENRTGFIPNLSIVDLLFNQGPQSLNIICKLLDK